MQWWSACAVRVKLYSPHTLPASLYAFTVQVASGASKLPGGRNWQLIDCAPVDGSGPGGVKALQALKQHLSDVLEVMLPAFGELLPQMLDAVAVVKYRCKDEASRKQAYNVASWRSWERVPSVSS
jgi:hypothetical protein